MIHRLRTPLKVIEWLVASLMASVAAFSQTNPSKFGDPFKAHVNFIVDWSVPILVGLAFATFAIKVLREIIDQFTTNREAIKKTLDALQQTFFQGVAIEDSYKNRVTLFKACYNPIRGKRFLKFYARSGTSYQRVKVRFTIDDGSEDKNEGVASRAYFMNSITVELDLPEWPNSGNQGDSACKEYCRRSHISWETANQLSVKSRSIAAVVVRSKAGQRWGVLVLDSRDPKGVSLGGPVGSNKKAMMNLVAQVLTNHV